jgi:glycosyltransferase involved in cell wall biosynthesis
VDGPAWAADHAAGRRPDASPHGLSVLGTPVAPTPARSRVARRLDGSLRHRGGVWVWSAEARTRLPRGTALRVCWDERTGVPALLRPGGPPVATGVIWLTDQDDLPRPVRTLAVSALRRARAVWALGSAQLPVLRAWGVPDGSLHWVPFGIDTSFWRGVPGDPLAEPLVLGVGNDRHRDHATLVQAMSGLSARLELVTALPVSVPPALGVRVPAADHVELRSRYAAASVVAVLTRPNLHVSGVTSVLEAQAAGRAVVVTHTPGIRDYVVPGGSALLVPPGDATAARDALASLLADPARAAAMGALGRDFVRTHRTSAAMVERLAEVVAPR